MGNLDSIAARCVGPSSPTTASFVEAEVPIAPLRVPVPRSGEETLAPYAMRPELSAGRQYPEAESIDGSPWEIDRERILRCAAFRRLSAKTQVFTGEEGDYHRTRLTHTLEVASIARRVGRRLRLNEDLIEALALAHDLGHPPFGHAGEQTLDRLLEADGGFCHNRHGLTVVEELEQVFPGRAGLNLTRELLEGQRARVKSQPRAQSPLLEAQVVEAADSLAYGAHDADDAIALGHVSWEEMSEVPLWREAVERVAMRAAGASIVELRTAAAQEMVRLLVDDLARAAQARLSATGVQNVDDLRRLPVQVRLSDEMAEEHRALGRFLMDRVYRHPVVLEMRRRWQTRLESLFYRLVDAPHLLPPRAEARVTIVGLRRAVGEYLAGMTDRYFEVQCRTLLDKRQSWLREIPS